MGIFAPEIRIKKAAFPLSLDVTVQIEADCHCFSSYAMLARNERTNHNGLISYVDNTTKRPNPRLLSSLHAKEMDSPC